MRFLKMRGDTRCSSEMGGTPDNHQKWGGGVQSAGKNGGRFMCGQWPREKGYGPLRVFFAPSLNDGL